MIVTVEGTVISLNVTEKAGKKYTNVVLHQDGLQMIQVRIAGDKSSDYSVYEKATFTGRLKIFVNDDKRPVVAVYVG